MKQIHKILIYLIKFYQITISPILGQNCRYSPTCSNYCIECFKKHGTKQAISLGFKRILSCHPFGGSGYDPVP
mgnify:CR=1 FL=1|tara:strand:+ start:373 stop:591 length:219 start_codon:yes stop_codon:yes gene_type:complete